METIQSGRSESAPINGHDQSPVRLSPIHLQTPKLLDSRDTESWFLLPQVALRIKKFCHEEGGNLADPTQMIKYITTGFVNQSAEIGVAVATDQRGIVHFHTVAVVSEWFGIRNAIVTQLKLDRGYILNDICWDMLNVLLDAFATENKCASIQAWCFGDTRPRLFRQWGMEPFMTVVSRKAKP